jgi:flagellar basal-body rod modification protein FlgD
MASSLSSLFGSSASTGTSSTSNPASTADSNSAPSEEVFLQLLVSQIQNQDPLNPADSTQFVSQLAQFSELEQVVAIRGDIETAMSSSTQQSAANPPTSNELPSSAPAATDPVSSQAVSGNPTNTSIN